MQKLKKFSFKIFILIILRHTRNKKTNAHGIVNSKKNDVYLLGRKQNRKKFRVAESRKRNTVFRNITKIK